ncbi:MAG: hypothetical protein HKP39_08745 [Eudoraea sp.]|nr:hypothetical protein [Maribacter sp.]NNL02346.1 hypothetical protein [Eudoraea sp.]
MIKKCILGMTLLATVTFGFTSCSKDDDDAAEQICESCTLQSETIELCDNGDDTYTLTAGGESETITKEELSGVSPEDFVGLICSLGEIAP